MATVNLGVIKPVFKGAYNNSTAYVLDNIVTSGGSSYICILASTGNAVSNATYWSQMSAIGTNPQLSMTWDNATADADNGAGKIAWNHATIASATILYVDDVDDAAASIQPYVDTWDVITNATAKGIVTITKEGAPGTFATFKVTGSVTDASGYSKVPVTHLASAGSFSDGDGVAVSFAYSGLDGADGTDVGTVITTAGDVLYRDASAPARLAKGTAAQVLKMNSGATAPEWGTAGKVLQVVYDGSTATTSGTGQNTWYLAGLQGTITPISTTSKFFIWYNIGVMSNNTSGDGGTSLRLQRTTGGSTTYPTLLNTHSGSGNQHSWFYTNGPAVSSTFYMMANIHAIDDQSHTTAAITYRVQFASYNTESCTVGGAYSARPIITIMEVEQ
jgi:hypothetical protein